MWDFVKMWLLLRALDEQEDYQVEREERAHEYYSLGLYACVRTDAFIVAVSNLSLAFFVLPLWVRRLITDKSPTERGGSVPNRRRLRRLYLLLGEASVYVLDVDNEKKRENKASDKPERLIRLRTDKEARATFITSYLGGLNALLSTNPAAWSFLAVTLSPQWIPWLVGWVCNYAPSLNLCS